MRSGKNLRETESRDSKTQQHLRRKPGLILMLEDAGGRKLDFSTQTAVTVASYANLTLADSDMRGAIQQDYEGQNPTAFDICFKSIFCNEKCQYNLIYSL